LWGAQIENAVTEFDSTTLPFASPLPESKRLAICFIAKNRFLPITAIQQMINCAGELDSRLARHLLILLQRKELSRAKLPRF
jgi:hypothetical protein